MGGLIGIGLLLGVVFLLVEARAKEPIIPLELFRLRDFSSSMAAVSLFDVALFAAVIFLPRFYQTVCGISSTASGYYTWPLTTGLHG